METYRYQIYVVQQRKQEKTLAKIEIYQLNFAIELCKA